MPDHPAGGCQQGWPSECEKRSLEGKWVEDAGSLPGSIREAHWVGEGSSSEWGLGQDASYDTRVRVGGRKRLARCSSPRGARVGHQVVYLNLNMRMQLDLGNRLKL